MWMFVRRLLRYVVLHFWADTGETLQIVGRWDEPLCLSDWKLTLVQDKHAEVITARRRDCAYVDPIQDMSDDALRREVGNLNTLFPVSASEDMRLQPYVQAIRDRCGQGR